MDQLQTAEITSIGAPPTDDRLDTVRGKYLTFTLGGDDYGLRLEHVREIIDLEPFTTPNGRADYVVGLVTFREETVPVIDLHRLFGLEPGVYNRLSHIMVVDSPEGDWPCPTVGLIADRVLMVEEARLIIPIDPLPDQRPRLPAEFILGLTRIDKQVKTLIDLDRVIASLSPDAICPPY